MCVALWQSEPSLVRSLFLFLGLLSSADDHLLFRCSICRIVIFLWLLFLYRKSVFALSLLKIIVFINFTARETLFSFNKLCKDAYSCLFIIRGTSLSICMTLKLSSSFHLSSLCSLIHGLMFCPHCADGSKILLLVDRVTYWLGSRLQRHPHWAEICTW